MHDRPIRAALLAYLRQHMPQGTLLLEECGIQHGQVRMDMATLGAELHGYELKSARDTLARLPAQVRAYSATLERAVLVAPAEHLEAAGALLPAWWGLLEVPARGGELLVEVRPALLNPAVDPLAVAQLLWREEALGLLEQLRAADGVRSRPRAVLYQRLVEVLPLQSLLGQVNECLRRREGWSICRPLHGS